jgi:uncharacterized protein (DUF2384 family)
MDITPRHRIASIRMALGILDEVWGFTDTEAAEILDTTAEEIRSWRDAPTPGPITDDRLVRVSYTLGIHKALDTLVPERSAHPGFLRRGAPALNGESPLDVMRQGPAGLRRVRRWLDGECGW